MLPSKESTCNAGDPGSIPEPGRSPGEGIGYPLQCSWVAQLVENPPARGRPGFDAWIGKIPRGRERLPIPVFWPGEFHGLYSPWVCRVRHNWATFTSSGKSSLPLWWWGSCLPCLFVSWLTYNIKAFYQIVWRLPPLGNPFEKRSYGSSVYLVFPSTLHSVLSKCW